MSSRLSLNDVFLPLKRVAMLLGLFTIEFPKNHRRPLLHLIYTVIVQIFCSYYTFKFLKKLTQMHIYVYEALTFIIILSIHYVVATYSIISFRFSQEKFEDALQRLQNVDDTLENMNVPKHYEKYRRINRIVVIVGIGVALITIITDFFTLSHMATSDINEFCLQIILHYPVVVNTAMNGIFVISVLSINRRFKSINSLLEENLTTINTKVIFLTKINQWNKNKPLIVTIPGSRRNKIKNLIQITKFLHMELCSITRQINRLFCMSLLLEVILHFTQITASFYTLYFMFSISKNLIFKGVQGTVVMGIWGLFYCLKVIGINIICGQIGREAGKTVFVIQEIDDFYFVGEVKEEVVQFLSQIQLRPLYLTASGFFTFDENFIKAFFGSVCTYLVIFVQMSNNPSIIHIQE